MARRPRIANTLLVSTMKGSEVIAKIAGIECAGQGGEVGHGGGLDLGETGFFQRVFNLFARRWVVVKADADLARVFFKQRL